MNKNGCFFSHTFVSVGSPSVPIQDSFFLNDIWSPTLVAGVSWKVAVGRFFDRNNSVNFQLFNFEDLLRHSHLRSVTNLDKDFLGGESPEGNS